MTVVAACTDEQQPSDNLPVEAEQETAQEIAHPTPSPEAGNEPEAANDQVIEYELIEFDTEDDLSSGQQAKDIIIAIDPGHQRRGNYATEVIGPGTTETKPKVTSGTRGTATGVPEYEFTLALSLLLRDELIARGYEVFMIRETHDVDISNKTRAEMAAESGAKIFVRIHANGSSDSSVNGILTISPTSRTPFIPALYSRSLALSQCILDEMVAATGAKNRGIWETDSMTGINWSTIPVTIIELGFMTNPEEDRLMQTPDYQQKLVEGIVNGIDFYFIFEFGD